MDEFLYSLSNIKNLQILAVFTAVGFHTLTLWLDRERCDALMQMGERMHIPEVLSFVNVVIQSIQYGSSIGETLKAYAEEMRATRDINAQEQANKRPVKMSGVMTELMLPALFVITLGPTRITYIRVLGD